MKNKFNIEDKHVESAIVQEIYFRAGFKTTICTLMLDTGFEVVGSHTSFLRSNSEEELIKTKALARDKAKEDARIHLESINHWQAVLEQVKLEKDKKEAEAALAATKGPAEDAGPALEPVPSNPPAFDDSNTPLAETK